MDTELSDLRASEVLPNVTRFDFWFVLVASVHGLPDLLDETSTNRSDFQMLLGGHDLWRAKHGLQVSYCGAAPNHSIDVIIHGFWCLQGVLEQIPCGYQGPSVGILKARCTCPSVYSSVPQKIRSCAAGV